VAKAVSRYGTEIQNWEPYDKDRDNPLVPNIPEYTERGLPQPFDNGAKALALRKFDTGAIRNNDTNKLDYSGFLSPKVLERFARYMHFHRKLPDGSLRSSRNWQSGIPLDSYKESLIRHTVDFWKAYEDKKWEEADNLACAIMFNVQGYLHERLKLTEQNPPTSV
jgi:hypothetical protein